MNKICVSYKYSLHFLCSVYIHVCNLQYALSCFLISSKQEVENKFGGYVFRGSPADKMIYELGSRGMVVKELVEILDHLRLENVLEQFKYYGN